MIGLFRCSSDACQCHSSRPESRPPFLIYTLDMRYLVARVRTAEWRGPGQAFDSMAHEAPCETAVPQASGFISQGTEK
ncbi:hypothetical protein EMIT048CA2_10123 [Pseudomonas chlororaphis]